MMEQRGRRNLRGRDTNNTPLVIAGGGGGCGGGNSWFRLLQVKMEYMDQPAGGVNGQVVKGTGGGVEDFIKWVLG